MKTKSILKLFFAAAVLIIAVSFAGCNLNGNVLDADGSAVSRGIDSAPGLEIEKQENKPTYFEASVDLYIVVPGEDSPKGLSNHVRVTEEQLMNFDPGEGVFNPIDSEWDELKNNNVYMTNITNYNMDELGNINGSNHSTINIMKVVEGVEKLVMTLEAHGTIVGNVVYGAVLDMNWTSVKDSGTFEGTARGKISGNFYWHLLSEGVPVLDEEGKPIQIYPYGIFTLTGSYN